MWVIISLILAYLLVVSWVAVALLFGFTRAGRPWRVRARMLARWSGLLLAIGSYMVQPDLFPADPLLCWLIVAAMAVIVGEGGIISITFIISRFVRHLDKEAKTDRS